MTSALSTLSVCRAKREEKDIESFWFVLTTEGWGGYKKISTEEAAKIFIAGHEIYLR